MARYVSPVDVAAYGEPDDARPLYRFAGRITADGSSGYRAEPGRYHLDAGWFCPWAQAYETTDFTSFERPVTA